MKYFIDIEFHEYKKKTKFLGRSLSTVDTIDLISIGIVADDDREYYAVCNEFDVDAAWDNEWLQKNVLDKIHTELYRKESTYAKTYYPGLMEGKAGFKRLLKWRGKSRATIAKEITQFASKEEVKPEFWGYYADYDWVVFCWLFGRMIDLPEWFPMFCMDLRQSMSACGLKKIWQIENCPDPEMEHNALADAKWNKKLHEAIRMYNCIK